MISWEDAVINVQNAVSVVEKKTNEIIDESKLKLSAAEIRKDINKKYQELGQIVYEQKKRADSTDSTDIDELIAKIDAKKEALKAIEIQIDQIKNTKKCGACCSNVKKDDVFCSKCGAKL